MVISYNYNKFWKLLIDRKISKTDLRRAAGILPNIMTRPNRDEEVTLETLGQICAVLGVNIGDIVDLTFCEPSNSKSWCSTVERY